MSMFKISLAVLFLASAGCGDDSTKTEETETTTGSGAGTPPAGNGGGTGPARAGEMSFALANAVTPGDDGTYQSSVYNSCRKDLASGLLSVSLGDGTAAIDVRIKDFKDQPATYTCRQAANNTAEADDLGDKYHSCMVQTRQVPVGGGLLTGYGMHRDATSMPAFTYSGVCTVEVSEVSDRVKAHVVCGGLIQTILDAAPRNPIDAKVTADLTGDFGCELVKE